MGGTTTKKVKDKEYLYYSYYDDGRKLSLYCGLATNPKSKKKAVEFEIEELEKQIMKIANRLKILKKKIN